MALAAFNLKAWIDENRHLLKPPVGNKLVWQDAEFQVMIVGGPNARKDYHIEEGEELFYQIEGEITVKIIEDGKPRDIRIKEGDIFLLPAGIPHSPQRGPNTIGMVVERMRASDEIDHLRWYCEKCGEMLYDSRFHCKDLGTQLKPLIENFFADESLRTCKKCGTVMQAPAPAKTG
jgi:3-hydroxyanthranilate 3,4-dioxygenase